MIRFILRALRFVVAAVRRMFRYLFKGSTVLIFLSLLAFNVASLTISSLNAMLSSLIETVSGLDTVRARTKSEIETSRAKAAKAEADLDRGKSKSAALEKDLKKTKADLDLERGKSKQLASKAGTLEVENRRLRVDGPDVEFQGKRRPLRSVVEETAGRIEKRTAKVAATNVGSMAGEGIPFWGIAVIVAATGYEVASACLTMKDMHELSIALSPGSTDDSEVQRVCGLRVPTKEELWASIKASPGAAWDNASDFFSSLQAPDFSGSWDWLTQHFSWE
jgi:hypothetical protein